MAFFGSSYNNNTGIGYSALLNGGPENAAVGANALKGAHGCTAIGYYALHQNHRQYQDLETPKAGYYNTGVGYRSLESNIEGDYNTAIGSEALFSNTAGQNVAVGNYALRSNTDGTNNTSTGYKEDVSGLEFISQLRPVSYTVDKEGLNRFLHIDDSSSIQAEVKSIPVRKTGFIAQEVEALIKKTSYVFSGVDAPENENDPYGIRYAEFVVPLVKAVQEQQKQIEEQNKKIESLLKQLGSMSQSDANSDAPALLFQNNPNPFDAESEIKMTLRDNVGYATITIYNLEGKQLKNIQVTERGDVQVKILGNELSAGMYLYSLIADGKVVDTKRMVLTR